MPESGERIETVLLAETAEFVRSAAAQLAGFQHLFWQRFDPHIVATWDRFPAGFFEHYYGTDADRECSIAKAVRARWACFTFAEARAYFGRESDAARLAERVWDSFGVRDGVVISSGRQSIDTVTVFGFETPGATARLPDWSAALLSCAASKLDSLLLEADDLIPIPRQPMQLSPAMRAVLQVAIDHPTASLDAQAAMLEISRRMLEKRHGQIAKRFGVSSFAGAVAIAVRESVEVGRT